jgi:outer membrane protein assembly factor BamB
MPRRCHFVLICSIFALLSSANAQAEEVYWNQYRGPNADGVSTKAKPPIEFGHDKNVRWKTPIHGKGWSSPVVWGQQIWLTTAPEDGTQLSAVCVNLSDGSIEHDLLVFEVAEPKFCHETNSYASCTPVVEQGRIYVHFGAYGTACLDTQTGKTLWERRDFECDDFRGPASSPILHGGLLFLQFDGIDQQYVVALDKQTGDTIWKTYRDIDYGTDNGDFKKAYATPTVIRVGKQEQLVCPAAVETHAYDLHTGKEIWRILHGGMNAAARPIYKNGLVYLSAGRGETSLIAVRPPPNAEGDPPQIVWNTSKVVPNRSSQIVVGNSFYMISDGGVASLLSASSGENIWSKRLGGEFWASPVLADERVYYSSKEGSVFVLRAGPEFEILAENQFPAGFNASPAFAGDSLILRSFTHLYRIGQ